MRFAPLTALAAAAVLGLTACGSNATAPPESALPARWADCEVLAGHMPDQRTIVRCARLSVEEFPLLAPAFGPCLVRGMSDAEAVSCLARAKSPFNE